jgi:Fur family transcriptional regulator, ferric uptake regulator
LPNADIKMHKLIIKMPKRSRQTRQKDIMEAVLDRFNSLFVAEDFHKKLLDSGKRIGIATVYRFLKEKEKSHRLHSYICNRKTLYSKSNQSHCHFTCEKCGRTEHFNVDRIDFLKTKINEIDGEICHFQIDVSGLCKICRNK